MIVRVLAASVLLQSLTVPYDYIPDSNTNAKTIFIKNGIYEEIIG